MNRLRRILTMDVWAEEKRWVVDLLAAAGAMCLWFEAVDTTLAFYRHGIDQPSWADFIEPSILALIAAVFLRDAWRSFRAWRRARRRERIGSEAGRAHPSPLPPTADSAARARACALRR